MLSWNNRWRCVPNIKVSHCTLPRPHSDAYEPVQVFTLLWWPQLEQLYYNICHMWRFVGMNNLVKLEVRRLWECLSTGSASDMSLSKRSPWFGNHYGLTWEFCKKVQKWAKFCISTLANARVHGTRIMQKLRFIKTFWLKGTFLIEQALL